MSHTPHDHLVRHVFAHPAHARGLLRHMLPDALAAHVDWDTLEHVPGSFVDSTLRDGHADLLYRVRVGERTLLCYLLLEHQGAPDRYMPLRMLGYAVRAWEYVARSDARAGRVRPAKQLLDEFFAERTGDSLHGYRHGVMSHPAFARSRVRVPDILRA